MSILQRLARAASEYIRRRSSSRPVTTGQALRSRAGNRQDQDESQGGGGGRVPPRRPITGSDEPDDEYDDIELLGRDYSYAPEEYEKLINSQMRLVNSSNVYGYAYQAETERMGILYVQFLNWTPKDLGGDGSREGPGPLYAYYNFPAMKFKQFEAMAESSAGSAVWDYCRVRHSKFEHQHTYRLISTVGEYVPRRVTSKGFKSRSVAPIGIGPRKQAKRSQLLPESIDFRRQLPTRNYAATPNRGAPNRGAPNRG